VAKARVLKCSGDERADHQAPAGEKLITAPIAARELAMVARSSQPLAEKKITNVKLESRKLKRKLARVYPPRRALISSQVRGLPVRLRVPLVFAKTESPAYAPASAPTMKPGL
jgi:hypothetical protein